MISNIHELSSLGNSRKVSLSKLPKELSPEALVAAGCAAPTMIHSAEKAGIKVGDTVMNSFILKNA